VGRVKVCSAAAIAVGGMLALQSLSASGHGGSWRGGIFVAWVSMAD